MATHVSCEQNNPVGVIATGRAIGIWQKVAIRLAQWQRRQAERRTIETMLAMEDWLLRDVTGLENADVIAAKRSQATNWGNHQWRLADYMRNRQR